MRLPILFQMAARHKAKEKDDESSGIANCSPMKPFSIIVIFAYMTTLNAAADLVTVYIGTQGKAIHLARLDTESGKLSALEVAAEAASPGFLAIHPSRRFLYATSQGMVRSFLIDSKSGKLTELNAQPCQGNGPCHVSVDAAGRFAFVANYGDGTATSYKIGEDGKLGAPNAKVSHAGTGPDKQRQEKPHAHSLNTSPDGQHAYVADLGIDKVMIYDVDQETGALTPNDPPFAKVAPGSGPRHFTFSPAGKRAYLLNELNSTVSVFSFDSESGSLSEIQSITTLPEDFKEENSTSEILCHPSGKFVYAANRGHNSIAAFLINPEDGKLTFIEREAVPGDWPRNFGIDPTGGYLLVAATNSNNVPVLKIDQKTGALSDSGVSIDVPGPMCVRFIRELDESGFSTLFDGKTLDGWEGATEWFRVADGAIVAGSPDKEIPQNEFLVSKEEYGNFELRYEARLTGKGNNAGVQFWSQRVPDSREMSGYQADIGGWSEGMIWGWLYDESRRRKMLGGIDGNLIMPIVRESGWNEFIVRAEGTHISIWLNGLQTLDFTETDSDIPTKGRFGLQIHSGPPTECSYRNIRVKRLD